MPEQLTAADSQPFRVDIVPQVLAPLHLLALREGGGWDKMQTFIV